MAKDGMYAALDEYAKTHEPVPAKDWDDDGCIRLAAAIISDARDAYMAVRQNLTEHERQFGAIPDDIDQRAKRRALEHDMRRAKAFFQSQLFSALTLGKVVPEEIMAQMDAEALSDLGCGRRRIKDERTGAKTRYTVGGGIRYGGTWYHNITELADAYGTSTKAIRERINRGMTLTQALTAPKDARGSSRGGKKE